MSRRLILLSCLASCTVACLGQSILVLQNPTNARLSVFSSPQTVAETPQDAQNGEMHCRRGPLLGCQLLSETR